MSTALVIRNAADVPVAEVKALAGRILNNRPLFPDDLTDQQAAELAMIALALGLDPLNGEVSLYEGRPLITLDGRIRIAAGDPAFDGIEYTRPGTADERKAFRVRDQEDLWVCAVWRKGVRFPSVGYGRAGGAYERNYLVKNAARGPEIARKRAIVNSIRLLFPMPRPDLGGQGNSPIVEEADAGLIIEAQPLPGKISLGQTKALHAVVRQLGITDTEYRGRLREMFGVRSSQELNMSQAQTALEAFTAQLAEQAEEREAPMGPAGLDAGVAAVKEREQAGGTRARDAITLRDEPEGVYDDSADSYGERFDSGVAERAQATLGGELDRYAAALTRAAALGIDLAGFAINANTVSSAELQELDSKLRELISENEPRERLL